MIRFIKTDRYPYTKILTPAENFATGIHVYPDAYVGGSRCVIFSDTNGYKRVVTKGSKRFLMEDVARHSVGIKTAGQAFVMPGYNYSNWFHLVGEVLFAYYRVSRNTDYNQVLLPVKVLRRDEIAGLVFAMGLKIVTSGTRLLRGFDKVAFYDVYHARLVNRLYGNASVNREYREYLSFVKKHFSVPEGGAATRKLFSARSPSGSRYDEKMLDVEARYLDKGYERVDFSTMSMAEQVKVMSQTSHLAGVHGANLVDLLFSPPGCKVYELYRPGAKKSEAGALRTDTFKRLSNELGIEYQLVEEML